MSKKIPGPSGKVVAQWSARRSLIAICLISTLLLVAGAAAKWMPFRAVSEEQAGQPQIAASSQPAPASASNPSREYVYAGSKLVAIEEKTTSGPPPLSATDTIGVFHPPPASEPASPAFFKLRLSNTSGDPNIIAMFGARGDMPIVGDWNGDSIDTPGVFRAGAFLLSNTPDGSTIDIVFSFGSSGDQPVAGDWNGDGIDTIGLYRNGTFFLRNSNSAGGADATFELGIAGDVGIAGDWNGDGTATTGVFRPSNGALYLKNTNTTGFADIVLTYGLPGDKPVTGDWNGDGIDTIGVYRGDIFFLRNSNTNGFADIVFAFGVAGDTPLAGAWSGAN